MMQVAEHENLETLAVESINQQEAMIGLLGELHHQLLTQCTDSIEKFNAKFTDLQIKTQRTDLHLVEELRHLDITENTQRLIARRKDLQKQIVQLLNDSLPKARNIKSLLASEMQSLRAGRRAMNGYKNGSARQGTIINRVR
jgi:hypothetical protein